MKCYAVFACLFLAFSIQANAQGRIEVSTTFGDATPPSRILAVTPDRESYFAELNGRWGVLEVPPGQYEIAIIPEGEVSVAAFFGPFDIADGAQRKLIIDSGIRLSSANALPPLDFWQVRDLNADEIVAQVVNKWELVLLPPGRYRIETEASGRQVFGAAIDLQAGGTTDVDVGGLGLGLLEISAPQLEQVKPLFGGEKVSALLAIEDDLFDVTPSVAEDGGAFWLFEGRYPVDFVSGSLRDGHTPEVVAGQGVEVVFDIQALEAAGQLERVQLRGVPAGQPLVVAAARGDRALAALQTEGSGATYIAPPGSILALKEEDTRKELNSEAQGGIGAQASQDVSLAVQAPRNGALFDPETEFVRVEGQASTTVVSGVTKFALLLDLSGSTQDPSGRDVDGDGQIDSILMAEVTAARRLLEQLSAIEDDKPGQQFAVGIVGFADSAQAFSPLLLLSEEGAQARLTAALDGLAAGMLGGSTYYDRGLVSAERLVASLDRPGPVGVTMFTDGRPSDVIAAIDAAARFGVVGMSLHMIGVGADFDRPVPSSAVYPPVPETGPEILATMVAFGGDGSAAWAAPEPSDIVRLVDGLPILETTDGGIDTVTITNLSTGQTGVVDLRADGSFGAELPVKFAGDGGAPVNRILIEVQATSGAIRKEEVLVASEGASKIERAEVEAQLAAADQSIEELRAALSAAQAAAQTAQDQQAREAAKTQTRIAGLIAELTAARAFGPQVAQCKQEAAQCAADLNAALDGALGVRTDSRGIVLSVPGDVLFGFDDADLREDAARNLELAKIFLADHQKADILIEGHTDGIGGQAYNAELSLERAKSVANWLTENGDIALDRIKALGLGESQPLEAETDADGRDNPSARQKNRRVEIRILK